MNRFRLGVLVISWSWLLFAVVAPIAIALKISFATGVDAVPPYTPLWTWEGGFTWRAGLDSYRLLAEDDLYAVSFLNALRLAAIATVIALLIGYPLALAIAGSRRRWALLLAVMLPFLTSFLIRVYAWMTLLRPTGLINGALIGLGAIDEPLPLSANEFAILVGMVYSYLPFMVLPLIVAIERVDPQLGEAAADLGARPFTALARITVPLSWPGIVAGAALVFVPAAGEFVIPDLLGGPDTPMIGRVLWNEFFANRDWPTAAAIAIALLLLLVAPVAAIEARFTRGRHP